MPGDASMQGKIKLTLSVIKADVGGFVGHTNIHPELIETAKDRLHNKKEKGAIIDYHVSRCGDDLELIMTHNGGCGSAAIHELALNIFRSCRQVARDLKLSSAGEDLVGNAFKGSVSGMGPCVAEMEFEERTSEPVLVFMADKASAGAWNLPIFRAFADPFANSGLVLDPVMQEGFTFRVVDLKEKKAVRLSCPSEMNLLLALIGVTSRYLISDVFRNTDGEIAATVSTETLGSGSEGTTRNDDPVAVIRCLDGFPAVGEALEPFAFPHLVSGWMRGAHCGPLMPVPFYEANPTRFDGPPRVVCAGFQLSYGRLIGPHDMFDDPSFDNSRRLADTVTEYMRRHGPFQPHRLGIGETDAKAIEAVMDRIGGRFEEI